MAKKYILQGQLSIASSLLDFVNNELLLGTGVTEKKFCFRPFFVTCNLSFLPRI